ncbi:DgyrCDS6601 [Dimorphilus gyrociliatus]|uniref:DgyrCDS6601 n=1 Tax=Dimorphilus gyrociliatus TaxID=2664684 RepID=A0A7I8VQU0_9ANNE|nr:DgyrCDS6601 [Dimorphilus gyrociliatus]
MSVRQKKYTVLKVVDKAPSKYNGKWFPSNADEQKEMFFESGELTTLVTEKGSALSKTKKKQRVIRREFFFEALRILEKCRDTFGDAINFFNYAYGKCLDSETSSQKWMEYLDDCGLTGEILVYLSPKLVCSSKIVYTSGSNKLDNRKFTLLINSKNHYLRERGVGCLADHEIATHYIRAYNDGYQPWFNDRKKFGLKTRETREWSSTEEGLASLNTTLNAKSKLLWQPAILYYVACLSETMTFKELFDHLGRYLSCKDTRWRYVLRVKRLLPDPNAAGGHGGDQVYFEGAITILKNLDSIDFNVLYSGKVVLSDLNRVKRLARMNCLRLPRFMKNVAKYKRSLHRIAREII